MPPIAFLVLFTLALLALAALRLELNFRRSGKGAAGEPRGSEGERPSRRPELRTAPSGGYCQPPLSPAFAKS